MDCSMELKYGHGARVRRGRSLELISSETNINQAFVNENPTTRRFCSETRLY